MRYRVGFYKDMKNSKFRLSKFSMEKRLESREEGRNMPNYVYFAYSIMLLFFLVL